MNRRELIAGAGAALVAGAVPVLAKEFPMEVVDGDPLGCPDIEFIGVAPSGKPESIRVWCRSDQEFFSWCPGHGFQRGDLINYNPDMRDPLTAANDGLRMCKKYSLIIQKVRIRLWVYERLITSRELIDAKLFGVPFEVIS